MVDIKKNTKFTARAVQLTDFINNVKGYDFSYPVFNTIEICNLFLGEGPIEIQTERMGKSTWTYDSATNTLTIEQKGKKNTWYISDANKLGAAMIQYYNDNSQSIFDRNYETNMKKSKSKIGNQNAKSITKENSAASEQKITEETDNSLENNETDDNNYPIDFLHNIPKIIKTINKNSDEFCTLDEFLKLPGKSIAEYFYWVIGNSWLDLVSLDDWQKIKEAGFDPASAFNNQATVRHYIKCNDC